MNENVVDDFEIVSERLKYPDKIPSCNDDHLSRTLKVDTLMKMKMRTREKDCEET